MPFLALMLIGGYLLIKCIWSDAAQRRRMNDYMAPRIANGAHLPTDRDKEEEFLHELEENYEYGDKSMFPPEKIDFFAHYPGAWHFWATSEAEERMIALGYAPNSQWLKFDRTTYTDHYFYRTSFVARDEKEYYRQKAVREKYTTNA